MESSCEAKGQSIDPRVGGLVWILRRNGTWWPGQILGLDELPECCLLSARPGTPVKLLGREDLSLDWYNLEKSKRVKAFRCGEFDKCIEKAKVTTNTSCKKRVRYACREDAIFQALEIEKSQLSKNNNSETISPTDKTENVSDKLSGLDIISVSPQELSRTAASADISLEGIVTRETINDLEDGGTEGSKKCMQGLQDLGVERALSSFKKKQTRVVHTHDCLKKKPRRRLKKVLKETKMATIHVMRGEVTDLNGSGTPDAKYNELIESFSDSTGDVTNNINKSSCKQKEHENSSISELPETDDSSGRLFNVPFVREEKKSAGYVGIKSLVWVQRTNGSWWPGRILGPDELPESCVVSPKRSGTPVKLLGREDARVDWYNLEKSKRIKEFRCGEYDECIETTKANANISCKKAVSYACWERAVLQALEIENSQLSKNNNSETISQSDKAENISDKSTGLDIILVSPQEPSRTAAPADVSLDGITRQTVNNSEDDGTEGSKKRMRGLQDLEVERALSSFKKKQTRVAHIHDFLKKKSRRRSKKVLKETKMASIPVMCGEVTGLNGSGTPDAKYNELKESFSDSTGDVTNNINASSCKQKEHEKSSISELPKTDDSSGRLFDVSFVREEKQSAGYVGIKSLVWVQRRNGSWWPGRILGPDELPESCVVSPRRSGTPVKLLGREDARVDWYNLEKSKRIKAFRCGEYDDCIERTRVNANISGKKAVNYACWEHAVLQALEIENSQLSKNNNNSETISQTDKTENISDKLSGLDFISVSPPELSHTVAPADISRQTVNNSEDDGTEGSKKRMRGLQELGAGRAVSSFKKKRTQLAHIHDLLKKKKEEIRRRRRQLTKVLKKTKLVTVPVMYGEVTGQNGSGTFDAKVWGSEYNYNELKARFSDSTGDDTNTVDANSCKQKEHEIFGISGLQETDDSSGRLFDVRFVQEEKQTAGSSPALAPDETIPPDEFQESGPISSGPDHIIDNNCSSKRQPEGKTNIDNTIEVTGQQTSMLVDPKHKTTDFGSLYDVNIDVRSDRIPGNLRYTSLLSNFTGQPVTGHSVKIEVVNDDVTLNREGHDITSNEVVYAVFNKLFVC